MQYNDRSVTYYRPDNQFAGDANQNPVNTAGGTEGYYPQQQQQQQQPPQHSAQPPQATSTQGYYTTTQQQQTQQQQQPPQQHYAPTPFSQHMYQQQQQHQQQYQPQSSSIHAPTPTPMPPSASIHSLPSTTPTHSMSSSGVGGGAGSSTAAASDSMSALASDSIGAFVIFCQSCRTIVGDSLSLVTSDQNLNCICTSEATNILPKDAVELSTSGPDAGCTYTVFCCQQCSSRLGRIYKTTTVMVDAAIRELFSFSQSAVCSYVLGKCTIKPMQEQSMITVNSLWNDVSRLSQSVANIEQQNFKFQKLIMVLHEKLDELNTQQSLTKEFIETSSDQLQALNQFQTEQKALTAKLDTQLQQLQQVKTPTSAKLKARVSNRDTPEPTGTSGKSTPTNKSPAQQQKDKSPKTKPNYILELLKETDVDLNESSSRAEDILVSTTAPKAVSKSSTSKTENSVTSKRITKSPTTTTQTSKSLSTRGQKSATQRTPPSRRQQHDDEHGHGNDSETLDEYTDDASGTVNGALDDDACLLTRKSTSTRIASKRSTSTKDMSDDGSNATKRRKAT